MRGRQDEAEIEPEHASLREQSLDKGEVTQRIAGPQPLSGRQGSINRPPPPKSVPPGRRAYAQNGPDRRMSCRRTITSQASAKTGKSAPVSLLKKDNGHSTPQARINPAAPDAPAALAPTHVRSRAARRNRADRLVMRCTTCSTGRSWIGCSSHTVARITAGMWACEGIRSASCPRRAGEARARTPEIRLQHG